MLVKKFGVSNSVCIWQLIATTSRGALQVQSWQPLPLTGRSPFSRLVLITNGADW